MLVLRPSPRRIHFHSTVDRVVRVDRPARGICFLRRSFTGLYFELQFPLQTEILSSEMLFFSHQLIHFLSMRFLRVIQLSFQLLHFSSELLTVIEIGQGETSGGIRSRGDLFTGRGRRLTIRRSRRRLIEFQLQQTLVRLQFLHSFPKAIDERFLFLLQGVFQFDLFPFQLFLRKNLM